MNKWLNYASSSNWLRVVGVGTIIILGSYLMIQQTIRLGANDLPLQTAQTIRAELQNDQSPKSVVPIVKTDLKNDDTVFVTVVDSSYKIVTSSAQLDGSATLPPDSAFSQATSKGSNWFTWEPVGDVRQAVEILPYQNGSTNGYILAGQSLKPFEDRVNKIGWIALATWIGVVLWATFIPIPYRKS